MEEREAQELFSQVGVDLRAPTDVRSRIRSQIEAVLAGEDANLPFHREVTVDQPLHPSGWDALPEMLIVPADDGPSTRGWIRGPLVAAAAAAILIVVMFALSDSQNEDQAVVTDNPPGSLIADPDVACGRFLDAPFDHELYVAGVAIDPAMLMIAEQAFAQLRADFEQSEDQERVAELLGSGTTDSLARIENLIRQARLQSEQGNQGGARRTLQTIAGQTALLAESGSSQESPCLGG